MNENPKPVDNLKVANMVVDSAGFLLAAYLIMFVSWFIDRVSHTPSSFDHLATLLFALALSVTNLFFAEKVEWLRQRHWIIRLATASMAGAILYITVISVFFTIFYQRNLIPNIGVGILFSPLIAISISLIVLIVRLLAKPIISVFRPSEDNTISLR